jgi:hypothetical protein
MAEREKQLATACSKLEELLAARSGEAQKVWNFMGQTEATLVPLDFSPLRIEDPVEEVSVTLPLLDSAGAKMLNLEEVIGDQLEAEGRVLATWQSMC